MSKTGRAEAHLIAGKSPRHIGRALLLMLLAFLLTISSALAIGYYSLQSNINQTDVSDLLGGDETAPPIDQNEGRPLNILVLGSDTREGQDIGGDVDGMRADTTMLFHISEDRKRIDVVSIPRDLLVEIPTCTVRTGEDLDETFETSGSSQAMFNAAFSYGGQSGDVPSAAACSMKTVENMTGIKLDGYVVLNFSS
ncbi:MAG: LCP family protein, partial [Ancrocorticia sp.]